MLVFMLCLLELPEGLNEGIPGLLQWSEPIVPDSYPPVSPIDFHKTVDAPTAPPIDLKQHQRSLKTAAAEAEGF